MARTAVTAENAPAPEPKHEHDATTHSTQDTCQTVFPDVAEAAAEAAASPLRGPAAVTVG